MNFFIHLLPILFIIFTCADTPNKPVIRKELFGWAGAPEDINKKPHECFYAKFYGKVEILSSKLRAEDYKNKCIQSATKQAKEEMLLMALHYSFLGGNDIDGVYLDLPIFEKNMKKKSMQNYSTVSRMLIRSIRALLNLELNGEIVNVFFI